jgi:hypothetical protein
MNALRSSHGEQKRFSGGSGGGILGWIGVDSNLHETAKVEFKRLREIGNKREIRVEWVWMAGAKK